MENIEEVEAVVISPEAAALLSSEHFLMVSTAAKVATIQERESIQLSISSAWIRWTELMVAMKAQDKRFKEELIKKAEENGIREVPLYGTKKLIFGTEKKDVFDSEKIKEALGFNEQQLAVLPKNPDWKKSIIVSIPETCDMVKTVTVPTVKEKDMTPKKIVKELDERFLK